MFDKFVVLLFGSNTFHSIDSIFYICSVSFGFVLFISFFGIKPTECLFLIEFHLFGCQYSCSLPATVMQICHMLLHNMQTTSKYILYFMPRIEKYISKALNFIIVITVITYFSSLTISRCRIIFGAEMWLSQAPVCFDFRILFILFLLLVSSTSFRCWYLSKMCFPSFLHIFIFLSIQTDTNTSIFRMELCANLWFMVTENDSNAKWKRQGEKVDFHCNAFYYIFSMCVECHNILKSERKEKVANFHFIHMLTSVFDLWISTHSLCWMLHTKLITMHFLLFLGKELTWLLLDNIWLICK